MSKMGTVQPLDDGYVDRLLQAAERAARRAAPLILRYAGASSFTDKQDGSPVTDTDVAVEAQIKTTLEHEFPDIPVYGEEGGYEDTLSGTFWLVDPIDGTKSFIKGIPTFTTMLVLIHGEQAVASLIYDPSHDAMYTAKLGGGAYRNDVRLDLHGLTVPPVAFCKEGFISALDVVLGAHGVHCENAPTGGGYGFAMVAAGQAAARFNLHSRGSTHDYAPGALLVHEAGGVIIPVAEDVYTYRTRSFVACHPQLEGVVRAQLSTLRELEQSV